MGYCALTQRSKATMDMVIAADIVLVVIVAVAAAAAVDVMVFVIDIEQYCTFVPLLGPIGGGGGGLAGGASPCLGTGDGAAASWARTTSLLVWELFLEKKMEAREDVVVLVGMSEVSTKLEAAEAMLEVAMAFPLSLSLASLCSVQYNMCVLD